jgi:tetratricopeptide (TPR) repeat protein
MSFRCVVGGSHAAREMAAQRLASTIGLSVAGRPPVSRWPFERQILPADSASEATFRLPDLHTAFMSAQTPGTRLVLTQSTYQLQRWLNWLDGRPPAAVVAHASRAGLERAAPEAFTGRGPWAHIEIVAIDGDEEDDPAGGDSWLDQLRDAFRLGSPDDRLKACAYGSVADPSNPALPLAEASTWMELQELTRAREALERALALASDWEACWFEYGKLWLRADDIERAADRFAEAARLMPTFSAALSNLGAALAETDRPEAAIDALQQALRFDPAGYPILNNLGVICRERGRLDEAVEAGRRVIALAPDFVFGYYNLGHALFLQGKFDESRDAYEHGHARDRQKNPVQASRLAVARAAAGDADRARAELKALADSLSVDDRDRILGEVEERLQALAGLGRDVQGMLADVRVMRNGPDF